jgi:hypothetical protein
MISHPGIAALNKNEDKENIACRTSQKLNNF